MPPPSIAMAHTRGGSDDNRDARPRLHSWHRCRRSRRARDGRPRGRLRPGPGRLVEPCSTPAPSDATSRTPITQSATGSSTRRSKLPTSPASAQPPTSGGVGIVAQRPNRRHHPPPSARPGRRPRRGAPPERACTSTLARTASTDQPPATRGSWHRSSSTRPPVNVNRRNPSPHSPRPEPPNLTRWRRPQLDDARGSSSGPDAYWPATPPPFA